MVKLVFQKQEFELAESETVLDCLLRHGISQPFSCRSGICQTCIMKADVGAVAKKAQQGLKPNLQVQGYFLACLCIPENDLQISSAEDVAHKSQAILLKSAMLNGDIVSLIFKLETPFEFRGGQFIHVHSSEGIRSYSIASPSDASEIELHVKRIEGGRVSNWLHGLKPGECLQVSGPLGECFYLPKDKQQNILLAGTGSGLAPLWAILQDAEKQGHEGKLVLLHGSLNQSGLYFEDELRQMADRMPNFEYRACLLQEEREGYESAALDQIINQDFADLKDWSVYLCGDADLVNKLKRQCFLAGASLNDIHADPFIITPPG